MIFIKILAFLVINSFVFGGWYLVLFKKYAGIGLLDRLLGTFVLGFGQIILTELLLGISGGLHAWLLFVLNTIISLILIYKNQVWHEAWHNMSERWQAFNHQKRSKFFWAGLGIFLVGVAWIVFIGLIFPPHDWDGLAYHLGWVGYVMQTNSIHNFNAGLIWVDAYPKNIELSFLWNTIFLRNGLFVDLSQLVFGLAALGAM